MVLLIEYGVLGYNITLVRGWVLLMFDPRLRSVRHPQRKGEPFASCEMHITGVRAMMSLLPLLAVSAPPELSSPPACIEMASDLEGEKKRRCSHVAAYGG